MSDQRRQLANRVLGEGASIAGTAREFGVSRQTAHLWVSRARSLESLAELDVFSRRPHRSPRASPDELREQVLSIAIDRPSWGGRKIHAALWPDGDAPVCSRTVERILASSLQARQLGEPSVSVGRFERATCNELWQADFKGLGVNPPRFRILSVIDDRSRFVIALRVVPRATNLVIYDAFWDIFGQRGLPEALLTDNEACFHTTGSRGPSYLEARLWRLGIATPHGRPRHPQTQGKVERFHGTMQQDLGKQLKERDPERMQRLLDAFREDYNWARPHEALDNRIPGAVYSPSLKLRPEQLPEPTHPQGAEIRRVDDNGRFKKQGVFYQIGVGLAREHVALLPSKEGIAVIYAGRAFALLHDLKV